MADVSSRETLSPAGPTDTAAQQQQITQLQQQQASPQQQQQQYKQALAEKDAQISVLQKKLEHYRSWLSSLQCQMQHKDPQVIKNARRLYIGGIPDGTKEGELRTFFDGIMNSTGASCGPGSSIITCKISSDKSYAFLEMRCVEEASNAMVFDGVVFQDTNLKIRRPSNYSPSEAVALGPVIPDPTIETSGLPMCKTVVEDSPEKIFIGGLPCHFTDEQVKDLLMPYGALKSFNLVMDKSTGKSKGYAFCEFSDPASIPTVIDKLHMHTLERKVLTVKRACDGTRHGGGGGGGGSHSGARMSGTPLAYHQPYAPFGGPGSSGSSRGAYFPTPHPGPGAMRTGSGVYSGSSYTQGGSGTRGLARGGSGSASPPQGGWGHGGHRSSPRHGAYSPHGRHTEPPFGAGPPPPPLLMGPPHPGGYGGYGYYLTPEAAAGGHSMGVTQFPAHGPLHGWPTHGMLGPGAGSSTRGSSQRTQQQQQYGSSSSGRGSYPSGHRQGATAAAAAVSGGSQRVSASPSPVAPTYGTSRDPPGAPGPEARPVSGHRASAAGASSTRQHHRPSDASSTHAYEH